MRLICCLPRVAGNLSAHEKSAQTTNNLPQIGLHLETFKHDLRHLGKPDGDGIDLLPLADLHIGDPGHDGAYARVLVEQIGATPGMFTVLDGDLMNCAIKSSVSDVYSETMKPGEQLRRCVKLFGPLADAGKILAILPGNHEERISKADGVDMTRLLAVELGLEALYSATSALLFLQVGRRRAAYHAGQEPPGFIYTVYVNHGNGGGRLIGAKANGLQRMSEIVNADVFICGHTHSPMTFKQATHRVNVQRASVSLVEQVFVNTASALDYGGYGDRAGFKPTSKSYPVIHLYGDDQKVTVTL